MSRPPIFQSRRKRIAVALLAFLVLVIAGCPVEKTDPARLEASVSSPSQGETVSGGHVTLAAVVSGTGLHDVMFYIDDNQVGRGKATEPGFAYWWDSTLISDGAHEVTVQAFDVADNALVSQAVLFVTRNYDATIATSALTPQHADVVSGTAVTLTGEASGSNDITEADHSVDDWYVGHAPLTIDGWALVGKSTRAPVGAHVLRSSASDAQGNPATSPPHSFSVTNGPGPQRSLEVESTSDLGALTAPSPVIARDDGLSASSGGGSVLWAFGDTLLSPPAKDGSSLLSNTAAIGGKGDITALDEPVDSAGAPFAFLGWTAEEYAHNLRSSDDRFALWPSALVRRPDGRILAGYLKLKARGGKFKFLGVGFADVLPGRTFGLRGAELVFKSPEPLFAEAALVDGGYLKMFNCEDAGCSLCRVPLDQAEDRGSYEFWNGVGWVSDVSDARPVMLHASASEEAVYGGMTVSWNAHLGQYLAAYVPEGSQDVVMRTAPSLTGPWSSARRALVTMASAPGLANYSGKEHPELSSAGGRRLVVTYARGTGYLRGELRAAEVTLR